MANKNSVNIITVLLINRLFDLIEFFNHIENKFLFYMEYQEPLLFLGILKCLYLP